MRTSHLAAILVAVVLATLTVPAAAAAQTAFRFPDSMGRHVTQRVTPPLTVGWYEIQTTGLSSGTDTVLAVFRLGLANAFAGADGCPGSVGPSCVRVQVTSPDQLELIVRAWDITTFGTGSLRIQRTDNDWETNYAPGTCPVGTTTVTDTCWYTWSGLTFGGFVAPLSAATNLHVETRQLPGATINPVNLWATGANSDPANNWRMRFIDTMHRSNVVGTREFTGVFPLNTQTLIAGPLNAPNPFELLRNDYGQFGSTTFGTDNDGDGLGASLEHNWLYTCDATTGPTYAGLACSALVGCSSPTSALCRASLRDTDQDGYEDALELYGFQSGIGLSPTNLARFGADPAKYDVFVEVDVGNQQISAAAPTCTMTGSAYIDYREATQIVRTYRTATMASFPNRYGTPGIQLHLDIPAPGALVRSDVAPPANDPNIGVWGGATCLRGPECTINSQCNFGSDTTGTCDPNAAASPRYCKTYDAVAQGMASSRRWLFRRMFAFGDVLTSSTQVYAFGPGGGTTPFTFFPSSGSPTAAFSITGSSASAAGLAHELGHHAGLDHSGPTVGHAQSEFDQNFSPLRYSRINYGYQSFGFAETPAVNTLPAGLGLGNVTGVPLGALPPLDFTNLDRVSFASAGSASSLNPLAVPETAVTAAPFDIVPFNTSPQLVPGSFAPWYGAPRWSMSAARDVDWDRRGGVLAAGLTEEAALYPFESRVRRHPLPGANRWTLLYTPSRFVVRNNHGWLFRATRFAGGPALTVSENVGAVPCANTPSAVGPRYTLCDFAPAAEVAVFRTPSLITVDPLTFSAASTGGATLQGAMVVWVDRLGGTLRWGLLQPNQFGALSPNGTIAGSPMTTFDGSHVISLARMGGSQNLSLVYREGTSVRESVMTWSGDTPSWSAPTIVPGLSALTDNASPGLVTLEGYAGVTDGVLMAFRRDASPRNTELWRRPTSSTAATGWVFVGTANIPASNPQRGAAQMAFSRVRRGGNQDWFLNLSVWANNASSYSRSDANSLTFPGAEGTADFDQNTNQRDLFPTSMTWDPREGTDAFRGLRGVADFWTVPNLCSAAAPCPTGETCTTVDTRTLCIADADGFPPGGVNCSTSLTCPSGMVCSPTDGATTGVCTLSGYVRAAERRLPSADGIVPGILEVLDDWRMLRQGYCLGMRLQRPAAPSAATIPGTAIPYTAPTPTTPEATCAFAVY